MRDRAAPAGRGRRIRDEARMRRGRQAAGCRDAIVDEREKATTRRGCEGARGGGGMPTRRSGGILESGAGRSSVSSPDSKAAPTAPWRGAPRGAGENRERRAARGPRESCARPVTRRADPRTGARQRACASRSAISRRSARAIACWPGARCGAREDRPPRHARVRLGGAGEASCAADAGRNADDSGRGRRAGEPEAAPRGQARRSHGGRYASPPGGSRQADGYSGRSPETVFLIGSSEPATGPE